MDNLNILIAFTAVTAAAVVIQAGMLVGMYLAVRKTGARVESLAADVKTKILPTADLAQNMLVELRPRISSVTENVAETSTLLKSQLQRVDATVNDALDRARLQVIRADELLSRTMDRVEETSDMVHRTVVSPVRQMAGVVQGLSAGLEFLLGSRRRRRSEVNAPQDEMFI